MRNYSLHESLMSYNFRRTAVLKKYELSTKATLLRIILKKIEGVAWARRPRTTFLNFLFICLKECKKVPEKITDKYMENLKQASGEI